MRLVASSSPLDALILDSAAGHVSSRVPVASPGDRAGDIRKSLVGSSFDTAASIVVTREGRLVGMLRIEDLLIAPDHATASELMDDGPPTVTPGSNIESVAWKAVHHGESTLAVIDDDRRLNRVDSSRPAAHRAPG